MGRLSMVRCFPGSGWPLPRYWCAGDRGGQLLDRFTRNHLSYQLHCPFHPPSLSHPTTLHILTARSSTAFAAEPSPSDRGNFSFDLRKSFSTPAVRSTFGNGNCGFWIWKREQPAI